LYDGLVATNRRPGAAASLEPDLAVSLPTPVDGGRTYAFRLRAGLRYSNGEPVRPSDFRRGFQRIFTVPGAFVPEYFSALRGAGRCLRSRPVCDLSSGISVEDRTRTITFHLTRPDPDFLAKLTLPTAVAVPTGALLGRAAATPLASTGPYQVASFTPGRSLELVRNPHFREWSRAAQPDGFPNRLVVRALHRPLAALDDVLAGTADLALAFGTFDGRMLQLQTRHPQQLHVDPGGFLIYLGLDAHRPPFDDVRARRALAFAVDRGRLLRLFGEPGALVSSCQIQPSGAPGYATYCPYRHDLVKAKQLVADSRAPHARVAIAMPPDQRRLGRYFRDLLTGLGYRTRLLTPDPYFDKLPRLAAQVKWSAFGADYVAASAYLVPLVGCESAKADPYPNVGGYCDRTTVEPLLQKALALQPNEPAAAGHLWTQVDHAVTDQAALLPWGFLSQVAVTSSRTGNYTSRPLYGVQLDQLWVR
jgi:peptide/nickel transport system substrate-binding protein